MSAEIGKELREAFMEAGVGLAIVSLDGHIRVANRRARALFSGFAEPLTGRSLVDLFEAGVGGSIAAMFRPEAKRRKLRVRSPFAEGSGWIELSLSAPANPGTELLPLRLEDVSAEVEREQERERIAEHLRASQRMESLGALAGGVAHDFNNLLFAILTCVDFARRDVHDAGLVKEALSEIEEASRRAGELTRQLLTFSRGQPLETRRVRPNELVVGVLDMLRRVLPANVTLDLDYAPCLERGWLEVDVVQFEQVVVNLCINARDAMPEGGQISIGLTQIELDEALVAEFDDDPEHRLPGLVGGGQRLRPRAGAHLLMRVTDTGEGMSAEVRERLFDPFFTTKDPGSGTGLGLAIVYGVVRDHGGLIEVESSPGEGSEFRIYLPLAGPPPRCEGGCSHAPFDGRGDETILIAEDKDPVRRLLARVLRDAGYSVLTATDGERALDILEEAKGGVALVLLNLIMPGMSARESYAAMRAFDPDLPVILTTGYGPRKISDPELAGLPTLAKPYSPTELLSLVRGCLDSRVSPSPSPSPPSSSSSSSSPGES